MSLTDGEYFDFRNCHKYILNALRVEASKRRTPPDSWVENERMAVMRAANAWADAFGRREVLWADVERVEQRALGHVDYATKFALYVAELVYQPAAVNP